MSETAADDQATPGDTAPPAPPEHPVGGIPPMPPPPIPPMPPSIPPSATTAADEYPTDAYPTYAVPQQGYPIPPGYPMPAQGYAGPAPVYAPPAGYAPPPQGYGPYAPPPQPPPPAGGSGLGIVAFVLAVIAAIGASILGSIAGYGIGVGSGRDIMADPTSVDFDWSILTPVRGWVLLGELAFWGGTVLGVWALVQSIIAIVNNRGRGWAIAALVIAMIGPIVFATGVQAFLLAGFASGVSVGG